MHKPFEIFETYCIQYRGASLAVESAYSCRFLHRSHELNQPKPNQIAKNRKTAENGAASLLIFCFHSVPGVAPPGKERVQLLFSKTAAVAECQMCSVYTAHM